MAHPPNIQRRVTILGLLLQGVTATQALREELELSKDIFANFLQTIKQEGLVANACRGEWSITERGHRFYEEHKGEMTTPAVSAGEDQAPSVNGTVGNHAAASVAADFGLSQDDLEDADDSTEEDDEFALAPKPGSETETPSDEEPSNGEPEDSEQSGSSDSERSGKPAQRYDRIHPPASEEAEQAGPRCIELDALTDEVYGYIKIDGGTTPAFDKDFKLETKDILKWCRERGFEVEASEITAALKSLKAKGLIDRTKYAETAPLVHCVTQPLPIVVVA